MYYIVFFEDLKKNWVVPKQWMKDIKSHKEKFYNNSLNHVQTFICFYTTDPNAFDDSGLPKSDYIPKFDIQVRNALNGDGLFHVKLKAYKGKILFVQLFSLYI